LSSSEDIAKYHEGSLYESVDGRGLMDAKDFPAAHTWVADGTRMLSGQAYVESIKIRINALPTLARTTRGTNAPRRCRAGCNSSETMHHVLQVCPRTHDVRVKRHDKVMNRLAGMLEHKGYQITKEPIIKTSAGNRKPDLVALKNRKATVIDTIIGGDYDRLDKLHTAKCNYYSSHKEIVDSVISTGAESVSFSACVISPRGIVAAKSAGELRRLGISSSAIRTLAVMAVELSAQVWHVFNRSTAHTWKTRKK